ncbi:hypothetical protein C1645_744736 [Glomus cerebriforme]|uniref:HTH cro/C1-type domain-containing protein n=1 Tax=Glomus cerebriforme TaxID=658196 RepID=A0A397S9Z8_9GLOM|nr:hypothetical protein C1645_744736 [Glomus cerebriforme]
MTRNEKLKPIHLGEILREELLTPLNISEERLAQELKVKEEVITEIIKKKSNITPEIALRLKQEELDKQVILDILNCVDKERDILAKKYTLAKGKIDRREKKLAELNADLDQFDNLVAKKNSEIAQLIKEKDQHLKDKQQNQKIINHLNKKCQNIQKQARQ